VRETELGKGHQRRGELTPQVLERRLPRTGFGEPRRGRALGIADELEQHLGAGDLDRVGHRDACFVEPA
jgi:hypothetical protein